MKSRLILILSLIIVLAVLALAAPRWHAAAQQPDGLPFLAAGGGYRLSAPSTPVAGRMAGGNYRLAPTANPDGSPVSENDRLSLASGGEYRLQVQAAPSGSENGCCCMFLPCIRH